MTFQFRAIFARTEKIITEIMPHMLKASKEQNYSAPLRHYFYAELAFLLEIHSNQLAQSALIGFIHEFYSKLSNLSLKLLNYLLKTD